MCCFYTQSYHLQNLVLSFVCLVAKFSVFSRKMFITQMSHYVLLVTRGCWICWWWCWMTFNNVLFQILYYSLRFGQCFEKRKHLHSNSIKLAWGLLWNLRNFRTMLLPGNRSQAKIKIRNTNHRSMKAVSTKIWMTLM